MAQELEVLIIAGPNGAGKTTFAREFLPHEARCNVFVNADLIAAGLAPFAPETAALQARVRQRVLQGGHDIPADVIARRFEAGYRNFENLYKPMVDAWAVYDNSGLEPVLINWGEK